MINRFFFFKATRETSLFKRHTCRLIIRMREAEIFQNRVLSGMDMPDHTNWFLCPPNNTGEYRSHYAAVSPNLHVTFSCIFPRDLSAGTFKLLTKKGGKSKKKKKRKTGIEERTTSRILFSSICNCYVAIRVSNITLKCRLWFSRSVQWKEKKEFSARVDKFKFVGES